jgi:hypothetical protein
MLRLKPKHNAAFERGRDEAKKDISAGIIRLYWGTRSEWGCYMEQLFRSRFGVVVEHTSSFVTDELVAYRQGYNSVVTDHIDQSHGKGAFEEANTMVDQFRAEWYAKNASPPA